MTAETSQPRRPVLQRRSLLELCTASRAAKVIAHSRSCGEGGSCSSTSNGSTRCAHCRTAGACLQCACGEARCARCTWPPLGEAAIAAASQGGWACEACLQEQGLVRPAGNYDFCATCGVHGSRSCEPLLHCELCRCSFHLGCVPCARQFQSQSGKASWSCSHCSQALDYQDVVCFDRWSLALIGQALVVRGVLENAETCSEGLACQTSPIVHALDSRTLVTRSKHLVLLRGPFCLRLARQMRLPRQLILHFRAGFPRRWHWCLRNAVHKLERQANKVSKLKTKAQAARRRKTSLPVAGNSTVPGCTEAAWTASELKALKAAVQSVKPSEVNFWEVVAAKLGRSAGECHAQAFAYAPAQARQCKGSRRSQQARPVHDAATDDEACASGAEQASVPDRDGPRKAKRARAFLNARSFGEARDVLELRPEDGSEERDQGAAPGGRAEVPSPGSLAFLGSLHTGCTPPKEDTGQRRLHAGSPHQVAELRRRLDFADEEEAFEKFDSSWAPKGIDGFICEMRTRRSKLCGRPLLAEVQQSSRRAEAELPKRPSMLPDEGDRPSAAREESSEEEEDAPIAVVPRIDASMGFQPRVQAELDLDDMSD
eukprot:TRINITY_DN43326_c0_g1_i1.p1 TRINITY_DN43326_c0_g1~~TRINITY_DN43326_c0_g1_i1.p1  ORF type:complete len:600 (+),score=99.10 TRINITY_DN43326_c0_g1_i1:50-1849(+)